MSSQNLTYIRCFSEWRREAWTKQLINIGIAKASLAEFHTNIWIFITNISIKGCSLWWYKEKKAGQWTVTVWNVLQNAMRSSRKGDWKWEAGGDGATGNRNNWGHLVADAATTTTFINVSIFLTIAAISLSINILKDVCFQVITACTVLLWSYTALQQIL